MTIVARAYRFPVVSSDYGYFRVPGTTKNKANPANLPVRRRVRLHFQLTGRIVREAWSDSATGEYAFDYISAGVYYVVAFDHTGERGGVIETDIVAEPMP